MSKGDWMSLPEASRSIGMDRRTLGPKLLSGEIPVLTLRVGCSLRINRQAWTAWRDSITYNASAASAEPAA